MARRARRRLFLSVKNRLHLIEIAVKKALYQRGDSLRGGKAVMRPDPDFSEKTVLMERRRQS